MSIIQEKRKIQITVIFINISVFLIGEFFFVWSRSKKKFSNKNINNNNNIVSWFAKISVVQSISFRPICFDHNSWWWCCWCLTAQTLKFGIKHYQAKPRLDEKNWWNSPEFSRNLLFSISLFLFYHRKLWVQKTKQKQKK